MDKIKITVGEGEEFETIADALEFIEENPGTYELTIRQGIYVWPEGEMDAVSTITIKGEKKMKNLIDQIKAMPGSPNSGPWWISREKVLEIVGDYLVSAPLGVVEVRGCTQQEIMDCLRTYIKQGAPGESIGYSPSEPSFSDLPIGEAINRMESLVAMLGQMVEEEEAEPTKIEVKIEGDLIIDPGVPSDMEYNRAQWRRLQNVGEDFLEWLEECFPWIKENWDKDRDLFQNFPWNSWRFFRIDAVAKIGMLIREALG